MANSSHSVLAQAEKRLKQLSTLSVGGLVNVPTLVRELHALLGFHYGTMWVVDEQAEGSIYFENPEPLVLLPLFKETFFERDGQRLYHSMETAFQRERGPTTLSQALKVSKHELLKSELYNQFMRPAGQGVSSVCNCATTAAGWACSASIARPARATSARKTSARWGAWSRFSRTR